MSIPVCKFYSSNRRCAFGKQCRFLHCESPGPPFKPGLKNKDDEEHLGNPELTPTTSISDKPTSLNSNQNEVVKSDNIVSQSGQLNNRTDNAQDEVQLKHENPGNKGICFYFKTYRNCRYGRDCKFSHIISDSRQRYKDGSSRQQKSAGKLAEVPPRFRKDETQKEETGTTSTQSNVINDMRTRNTTNQDGTNDMRPRNTTNQDGTNDMRPRNTTNQDGTNDMRPRNTTNQDGTKINGNPKNKAAFRSNTERRICRYFKRGYCSRGDYCQFLHSKDGYPELKTTIPKSNKDENPQNEDKQTDASPEALKLDNEIINESNTKVDSGRAISRPNNKPFPRPMFVKQSYTYAELDNSDVQKVRESEIKTIKKRFPQDRITILEETDSTFSAKVLFSPTDPDWTFDVRVFELQITIPSDYPRQMMTVLLPTEQNIPETVRRYTEVSIKEWLDQKVAQLATRGRVELVFRPFLLWLDRNIEDVTMEALKQWKRELVAKAAGMEFIPAAKLQEKFKVQGELCSDEDKENSEASGDSESISDETDDSSDDSEDDDREIVQPMNANPEKKGTEIELRHLQLKENASAMMFEKLQLVLQCGRCKNHSDLLVPPGKVMSTQCVKCSQKQFVHFRAALMHQFSSVVGYLDLDGCQVFDLVFQECSVAVTCMACSKQTRINGFVSGHMVDGWCQACNARFKLATEAVKFSQLVPSIVDTTAQKVVEVASAKQKRLPKDPAIREGLPLPEFGTCKHYKHSYRWLRFPCCGKVYPCDLCHDKKEDHEMEFATRMICGHCCREQNYSATRPCSSCSHHLTKIKTAHWEGGSGCRDKISMSKTDQQKYKNINKTLSNHKKKVQAGSTKKVTKLRHT